MACLSSSVSASSLAVLSVVPFWVFCAAPYLDAVDTAVPENKYNYKIKGVGIGQGVTSGLHMVAIED